MQPKRFIIAALVVVLIVFSAVSVNATTEDGVAIAVGINSPQAIVADGTSVTVKGQDTVEVSITAGEASGFTIDVLAIEFRYDTNLLEITSADCVSKYSSENVTIQVVDDMISIGLQNYSNDQGLSITLTFKVKAGAHGTADISIARILGIKNNVMVVPTVDNEELAVYVHTYGAGVVTAPTCTTEGFTEYTCTDEDCGEKVVTNKVSALGHAPGAAATCTTNQVCTREGCGVELAPALGHAPGAAATCTTNQVCTREGCGVELAPALGHAPGAAATCTTNQVCTREGCGVELAPALGHAPGAAATCTTNQVCTREGCGVEIAPANGHQMGDWVVDKEATTKEEGSKSQSCANCDHKLVEKIPMVEKDPFPWWIIVIVVVVLVGGFACYWFFVVKKKEN
ncbi:MAG: hypothetical protein J6L87_02790 [Clostridia bacterium]|nr:hypothetical protein [Clostridia bacterium]